MNDDVLRVGDPVIYKIDAEDKDWLEGFVFRVDNDGTFVCHNDENLCTGIPAEQVCLRWDDNKPPF